MAMGFYVCVSQRGKLFRCHCEVRTYYHRARETQVSDEGMESYLYIIP